MSAGPKLLPRFAVGFFALLSEHPDKAPTPTELNRWMGRSPRNSVDGDMTRWRTFLLRESGFRKKPTVYGRWIKKP